MPVIAETWSVCLATFDILQANDSCKSGFFSEKILPWEKVWLHNVSVAGYFMQYIFILYSGICCSDCVKLFIIVI